MSRKRSSVGRSNHAGSLGYAAVGRLARLAGLAVGAPALPLAAATLLTILLESPSLADGLAAAADATSGPLAATGGVGWLLHVGVLGLLVATWLYGFGLVLSGVAE